MKYIAYIRKSTDTEDKQVMSLDAQRNELEQLASQMGVTISKIYTESMSAKSPGRPVFNQVLSDIQSGKADAVFCWKLDRLARNFIDGGQIIDMLQRGVLKEIVTFTKTYLPSDNVLMMAVELGMANQYVRDLSENVKRGNREKVKRGEWFNKAPLGYLNDRVNKTVVIDPERAPYIKQMFEMYATGLYSYKDISERLHAEGLRSKQGGKVYKSNIQYLMGKSFYYGVLEYEGKYYQGNHEPLISQALFEKCQDVSENKSRPRPQTKGFTLSGFGVCKECGCATTAEIKKGKYIYYHCTAGKGPCPEKSINTRQENIHDAIAEDMKQLYISDKVLDLVYRAKLEEIEQDDPYTRHALETSQKALESIERRKSRLVDTFTNGDIEESLYKEKLQSLNLEDINLKTKIRELQEKQQDPKNTIELIYNRLKRGNTMAKRYLNAEEDERRIIASEALSNFFLQGRKVVDIQYKNEYSIMRKTHKNVSFSQLLPD